MSFAAIILFVLWIKGIFYIVERQSSPNGKITTTVYSRDVSDAIPKNTGFTIMDKGNFVGTRVYTDGSTFENLWWSPCSKYGVISTLCDGERMLELKRYEKAALRI